jgi:hypothetical protein
MTVCNTKSWNKIALLIERGLPRLGVVELNEILFLRLACPVLAGLMPIVGVNNLLSARKMGYVMPRSGVIFC